MEKCPRSGTSIRYLGSLCACVRVCMHVCVCKSVSKRTFISSSDIITLPQVEGGYQALTPPFSILIIHLLHPPFFFLYLLFLFQARKANPTRPPSEVITGLTYSQIMDLFLAGQGGHSHSSLPHPRLTLAGVINQQRSLLQPAAPPQGKSLLISLHFIQNINLPQIYSKTQN